MMRASVRSTRVPPAAGTRAPAGRAETGLRRQAHLADLVEKQRAAARLFELSGLAVGHGAGERAALVAEELGLERLLGKRGAVKRDKRTLLRAEARCRKRATTSLPVPDSPSRSAVVSVAATWVACNEHLAPRCRFADDAAIAGAGVELLGERADAGLEARHALVRLVCALGQRRSGARARSCR